MSIIRFFAGAYEHFNPEQAKHFLPHVLNPIYRILDEGGDLSSSDIGSSIGMSADEIRPDSANIASDDLRMLSSEVRDFVQGKVGTTEFSRAWEGLRKRVSERREGRKDSSNRLVSLIIAFARR